jgi:hypothetical protein
MRRRQRTYTMLTNVPIRGPMREYDMLAMGSDGEQTTRTERKVMRESHSELDLDTEKATGGGWRIAEDTNSLGAFLPS